MAKDTKQPDKDGSGEFSDRAIRRFLLGGLAAGETVIFEERLFRDENFEERVRLAELELADDYAFGRLTAAERERFESAFPVSVARRQQLRVSRALRDASLLSAAPEAASRTETRATARETFRRLFGINRPALGYAIGFAALLLFAGIVWVVVKERRTNQPPIARQQPTPDATREFAHPAPSPNPESTVAPQPTAKTSPTSSVSPSLPLIATFVLSPGALRDGGTMTRIAVPQDVAGIIRLQLPVEDEPGTCVAELLTAEGRSLYVSGRLKANTTNASPRVAFDVPGRLLKPGDYQVRLTRTIVGSTTSAGRYYFRVTQ